jgi:hypothetical protein
VISVSPATQPEPSHISDAETEDALQRYGIVAVPSQSFEYGGYRYTNIQDAVAEARRHPERRS